MPTSFGSYRKSPGHRSWSCEPIPGTIFETVGRSHAGYWVSDLAPAARRFRDDGWEQAMTDALGDEPHVVRRASQPLGHRQRARPDDGVGAPRGVDRVGPARTLTPRPG